MAASETERHEIAQALRAWNISTFMLGQNLGGSSRASWRIITDGGSYVLRRTIGQHEYLNYQILVLKHLEESNFPYAIPKLVPTADGAPYVETNAEIRWILYPYIAGHRPGRFAVRRVRKDIAKMVARFDMTAAKLDLGSRQGCYALSLFERDQVSQKLELWEGLPYFRTPSRLIVSSILKQYHAIPDDEIAAVAHLPKQTIYNDWHRWNLVSERGYLTGLIDFDSLVEAPRIVDVQNALGYVLMSAFLPSGGVVPGFMRGYLEVSPLLSIELRLMWPVMIDRLAWLLSDQISGANGRRIFRILRLLNWLGGRRDRLEAILARELALSERTADQRKL